MSPPGPLDVDRDDLVLRQDVLWRIRRSLGEHALAWDQLRTYGPVNGMRGDPQPPPPQDHPGNGVMYAASDIETTVAEFFGVTREIDRETGVPLLVSWTPTRPLTLLNLYGTWALRNGASAALTAAPRRACRNWACAIRETFPSLDGLLFPSTMTGEACTVLFDPAGDSFPATSAIEAALSEPRLAAPIRSAAKHVGYTILR